MDRLGVGLSAGVTGVMGPDGGEGAGLTNVQPLRSISGTASIFAGPVAVNKNGQAEWHLFAPLFPY